MALKLFLTLSIVIFIFISTPATSLPFVVFHGVSDGCKLHGVTLFTNLLSNWSGSQGHCIEIGNGAWDSWTMPFLKQTAIACEKVKSMSELEDGYNIVGLSQGNLIARGVIEMCDGAPPVRNYVSLAGPHAGIAAVPLCGSALVCIVVDSLIKFAIYSDFLQDLDSYRKGCRFLPKINNEFYKNFTYKERFSSLENLVLIMFEKDNVLVPRETSWFGYFPDGAWAPILPAQETTLYIEDWIGLRTLDEAGKVMFVNVSGGHLRISQSEMKEYILPYLIDNSTAQHGTLQMSSSHLQPQVLDLYD